MHGADVAQTLNVLLNKSGMIKHFTNPEIIGVIIAALVHDYDHPGVNNKLLITTSHKLAVRYNDLHVLENQYVKLSLLCLSVSLSVSVCVCVCVVLFHSLILIL